jgi:hypothetical protein
MTLLRLIRAMDPIAVELAGSRFGQVAVPDLIGLLGQADALQLAPTATIEEAQLDGLGRLGEQGEVDAGAVVAGPQGVGASRPHLDVVGQGGQARGARRTGGHGRISEGRTDL